MNISETKDITKLKKLWVQYEKSGDKVCYTNI